jgi:hypothetical protein
METPDLKRILQSLGVEGEKLLKLNVLGEAIVNVAFRAQLSDADTRTLFKGLTQLMDEALSVLAGADAISGGMQSVISDDQLARMEVKGRPC